MYDHLQGSYREVCLDEQSEDPRMFAYRLPSGRGLGSNMKGLLGPQERVTEEVMPQRG
jgi:hypothetical protein